MRFYSRWIEWLRQCITTVSFSVLVNGIPSGTCVPSRVIRQGDPLFLYFHLVGEILARQLHQASSTGTKTVGVKLRHLSVKIPFLTFVDDTIVAKATKENCHIIKNILDKYWSMPGQLVNYHKFGLQCTQNISGIVYANFASILQMPWSYECYVLKFKRKCLLNLLSG